MSDDLEDRYVAVIDALDWSNPGEHVQTLRELSALDQADAMNLLAVLLDDIDGGAHRTEIVALYERAFALGSWISAGNLAIQYRQWDEPELAALWDVRAAEADPDA